MNADIGHLNDPALSREALGGTVKPAVVQHSHTGWRLLPRHHQHPGRHRRLPLGDRRRTGQVCPGPHVLHDLVADKWYEVTFAGQQERITTVCRSPRWPWGGTCPTSSPIRERLRVAWARRQRCGPGPIGRLRGLAPPFAHWRPWRLAGRCRRRRPQSSRRVTRGARPSRQGAKRPECSGRGRYPSLAGNGGIGPARRQVEPAAASLDPPQRRRQRPPAPARTPRRWDWGAAGGLDAKTSLSARRSYSDSAIPSPEFIWSYRIAAPSSPHHSEGRYRSGGIVPAAAAHDRYR